MQDKKAKLLKLVETKSGLNHSERNSLLRSIHMCYNYGDDAESYLKTIKVPTSIIISYVHYLRSLGIPAFTCRESDRYNFMLYLSLQQTWNLGLGNIIQNTEFIPVGLSEKPKNHNPKLLDIITKLTILGIPESISQSFLSTIPISTLRYVVAYASSGHCIIMTFYKRGNKFEVVTKFENFSAPSQPISLDNEILSNQELQLDNQFDQIDLFDFDMVFQFD